MRLDSAWDLWRLWLVCSILWAAGWSVVFYQNYAATYQPWDQPAASANSKYKHCWDNIETRPNGSIPPEELDQSIQCKLDTDREQVFQAAMRVIFGIPAFAFVIGCAAFWVARRFVRTPT